MCLVGQPLGVLNITFDNPYNILIINLPVS